MNTVICISCIHEEKGEDRGRKSQVVLAAFLLWYHTSQDTTKLEGDRLIFSVLEVLAQG